MKPTEETIVSFSSSIRSSKFGMDDKNLPFIFGTLRKGLYTDKILAVLREYGSNAWDAHRMVGTPDRPFVVHVPTYDNPVLTIRDFGPGLSQDDVFSVYSSYGASTKRSTNNAVGMLGLGSKSGFAYGDSFTITSWYGGIKSTYSAFIDESKLGQIDLLAEEVSDQETGVEILLTARPEDIADFERKATALFRHFSPRPEINIELPAPPAEQTVLKHGTIVGKGGYYGSNWIAIMGCVPYRVNLQQLDETKISKCLPKLSGSLFFNIGDVEMAHSREELEYGTKTKSALIQKLNDLVDEYVIHALADLEQTSVSSWDKRLKAQILRQLDLPIPEEYEELAEGHVKLVYAPGTISVTSNENAVTNIAVNERTRFLVDDTGRALKGYYLNQNDYVVRGLGCDLPTAQAFLDKAMVDSGIVGIKVELLSTLNWAAPYVKPGKVVNPKHKAKMFTFKTSRRHHVSPYSDSWEMVDRVPEDTDVYVIISGFLVNDNSSFFLDYQADAALAEALGETMPMVYGYKTTEKKPAVVEKGRTYKVWREEWIKSLATPERTQIAQDFFWKEPLSSYYGYWPSAARRATIVQEFGENHLISQLFIKQADKVPEWAALYVARVGILKAGSDAAKAWAALFERYPLITRNSLSCLWVNDEDGRTKHWYEYVKLVDARNAALPHGVIDVQALDTEHWSG